MPTWFRLIPLLLIALGLGSLALSTVPDGSFVAGMFQGAGAALIVIGAFLAVQSLRGGRHEEADGAMWLPSTDARDDGQR